MKRLCIMLGVVIMVVGLSVSSQAALINMGDGTVYDTVSQLSWLINGNTAGTMNWSSAMAWANSLNSGSGFAGITNWRLPLADPACGTSFNCTASDMGSLYYTALGNTQFSGPANTGPFLNVQPSDYWTGTEYVPGSQAWEFYFGNGLQFTNFESNAFYAWADAPGPRTPVPEPGTLLLLGTGGLAGLITLRKKLAR